MAGNRLNAGLALAALSEPCNAIIPFKPGTKKSGGGDHLGRFAFLETVTSPYRSRGHYKAGGPRFGETLDYLRDRPGCPVFGATLTFPGKISTVSVLESVFKDAIAAELMPGFFGAEKGIAEVVGKEEVVAAVATTLGLGAAPVQDPHAWLRSTVGAKMDCRLDMLTKSLSLPSSLGLADDRNQQAVKIWNVHQAGEKMGVANNLLKY